MSAGYGRERERGLDCIGSLHSLAGEWGRDGGRWGDDGSTHLRTEQKTGWWIFFLLLHDHMGCNLFLFFLSFGCFFIFDFLALLLYFFAIMWVGWLVGTLIDDEDHYVEYMYCVMLPFLRSSSFRLPPPTCIYPTSSGITFVTLLLTVRCL